MPAMRLASTARSCSNAAACSRELRQGLAPGMREGRLHAGESMKLEPAFEQTLDSLLCALRAARRA